MKKAMRKFIYNCILYILQEARDSEGHAVPS